MKTAILILGLLAASNAMAWYPKWNPEWDKETPKQEQQATPDEWGHNKGKQAEQGDFDWDKHADRGATSYK